MNDHDNEPHTVPETILTVVVLVALAAVVALLLAGSGIGL